MDHDLEWRSAAPGPIWVLAGGASPEADISLDAAEAVEGALRRRGREVVRISWEEFRLRIQTTPPGLVFNLMYGELGEGGPVRALCDWYGVPCTYSGVGPSAIALDKWRTKLIAIAAGIPTTTTWPILRGYPVSLPGDDDLTFPLVLKPMRQGSSEGVHLVQDLERLNSTLIRLQRAYGDLMLEPFLPGREFTVGVLELSPGDIQALPVIEITFEGSILDREHKWSRDGRRLHCPANLDAQAAATLQERAVQIHRAIGCRPVSRSDFRRDAAGEPKLLEVNHYPGMTPVSWLPVAAEQVGISFDDLVIAIADAAVAPPPMSAGGRTISRAAKPHDVSIIRGDDGPLHDYMVSASEHLTAMLPEIAAAAFSNALLAASCGELNGPVFEVMYGGRWDGPTPRAVLDALGVSRVGSSALAATLSQDKLLQKRMFQALGAPTPAWAPCDVRPTLRAPVVVKHRQSSQSHDVLVLPSQEEFARWFADLPHDEHHEWLAEIFACGRELYVGQLFDTNSGLVQLPLLEVVHDNPYAINSAAAKATGANTALAPDLPQPTAEFILEWSARLHAAFGSPSLSRVEWRLDSSGAPLVLEFDHNPGMTKTSYIPQMLQHAGIPLDKVLSLAPLPPLGFPIASGPAEADSAPSTGP